MHFRYGEVIKYINFNLYKCTERTRELIKGHFYPLSVALKYIFSYYVKYKYSKTVKMEKNVIYNIKIPKILSIFVNNSLISVRIGKYFLANA